MRLVGGCDIVPFPWLLFSFEHLDSLSSHERNPILQVRQTLAHPFIEQCELTQCGTFFHVTHSLACTCTYRNLTHLEGYFVSLAAANHILDALSQVVQLSMRSVILSFLPPIARKLRSIFVRLLCHATLKSPNRSK